MTLGASNHTVNPRAEHDYYATDPRAVRLLLEMETFSDKIWECACGEGHISKVLEQNGYEVLSTDLIDRGYGTGGVDFLTSDCIFDGDIITNVSVAFKSISLLLFFWSNFDDVRGWN